MHEATDTNEQIIKLKEEGRSLREVGSILGISHVAVLKRLRAMEESRLVTSKGRKELPRRIGGNDNQPTRSIPHQSRVCRESKDNGNRVVTKMNPSSDTEEAGNSSGSPFPATYDRVKRTNPDHSDDLFESIKVFLEVQGIQICRMNIEAEAYQVKHKRQIIRFYVQRKETV